MGKGRWDSEVKTEMQGRVILPPHPPTSTAGGPPSWQPLIHLCIKPISTPKVPPFLSLSGRP